MENCTSAEPMSGDQGEKVKTCSCSSTEGEQSVAVDLSIQSTKVVEAVQEETAQEEEIIADVPREMVTFKVSWNRQKLEVTFDTNETVTSLKKHLEQLTNIPESMQKLLFKGKMTDSQTLKEHGVSPGSKIMLIGSTVKDLMKITPPTPAELKEESTSQKAAKEPLCQQKPHKTILEKHGKPEDAMPGILSRKEGLPSIPIAGMYNKSGGKVRLTFKLEQDELWIGTKERTEKIPMNSIKNVVSESIASNPEYHMMGIQLGPTEASRYWVYWVPAQYVEAIKDTLLGKWQHF